MKIEQIEFVCSSPSLKSCPEGELPEFAFIGRSNVGKSSLINMLAGRKGLAKVSGTPGKTRLINHFSVTSSPEKNPAGTSPKNNAYQWFLVDLPGYGFAKLSKTEREKFQSVIHSYLNGRENLALTFLLIDARHEPQKIDIEFMNWLGDHEIGFVILFTKTDKLSHTQQQTNEQQYRQSLAKYWAELPAMIPTSAATRAGREEVLTAIEEALIQCQ